MKNLLLLFSTFLLICISFLPGTAQNARLKDVYEKNVIRPQTNFFMRNDETLYRRQIYPLLLSYDDSASEFALYRKNLTISRILNGASLVATFLFLTTTDRPNQTDLYLFAGTSLAIGISSAIFNGKAIKHFNNSLWAYNRDILIMQY